MPLNLVRTFLVLSVLCVGSALGQVSRQSGQHPQPNQGTQPQLNWGTQPQPQPQPQPTASSQPRLDWGDPVLGSRPQPTQGGRRASQGNGLGGATRPSTQQYPAPLDPNSPPSYPSQANPPGTTPYQARPPQTPALEPRPPVRPPVAPFQLTPQQQADLDRVLEVWKQQSDKVKTYQANFTLWTLEPQLDGSDPAKNPRVEKGEVRYEAPDKGLYRITVPPGDYWTCNGTSLFDMDSVKKQVIEHKLPPELQGKAISNGPMPFLMGASPEKLKQRYFLRLITPRAKLYEEVWLEAHPRYQQDAAEFRKAVLVLRRSDMLPSKLQLVSNAEASQAIYQFQDQKINAFNPVKRLRLDPMHLLKDPFRPRPPTGWTHTVAETPSARTSRSFHPMMDRR